MILMVMMNILMMIMMMMMTILAWHLGWRNSHSNWPDLTSYTRAHHWRPYDDDEEEDEEYDDCYKGKS